MPPNPPSNAHGFAMRSMSLRDMQIPKSEKKISWPPPLPNPGDAPGLTFKSAYNGTPSKSRLFTKSTDLPINRALLCN